MKLFVYEAWHSKFLIVLSMKTHNHGHTVFAEVHNFSALGIIGGLLRTGQETFKISL